MRRGRTLEIRFMRGISRNAGDLTSKSSSDRRLRLPPRHQSRALCPELKSMTIPDSLQTFGRHIFYECSKLVPSNIIVNDKAIESTSEVVAHLRSEMSLNALLSGNNFLNTYNFRRLIVPYLPNDALMTIRLHTKQRRLDSGTFLTCRRSSRSRRRGQ